MALAPGTRLGPYEVVAPLGSGGMGEVYRARDTRLGREVAIKVLPQHLAASPEDRARFQREAKTISALNHPHICTLHDVGREGDTDFLVMELVDGETLAQRISRGALPTVEVLRIGGQVADALDRAHRAGVVHRDLKPGNIMLTKSGAKLMDFGLARRAALASRGAQDVTMTVPAPKASSGAPLTAQGRIVGTVQYMAPEQLEGKGVDARSDIWALGCVLYEMATGKRAFEGTTAASVISAIMRDQPREMAELAPLTPPALEQLVRACLAKDPEDRIQTAHDVRLQLTWINESGSKAATGPARVKSADRAPRRTVTAWVAAAVATILLIAVGSILWKHRDHQPRQGETPTEITKVPILVSEFDGPVTDPNLATAARQLVMAGFDQSQRFEAVPISGLRQALESAGKPESTHIDADLARELAFRNGIKVTVEGRIDRLGKTLSIVLTARDAETGRLLHSVTGATEREEGLIREMGELTSDLRTKLGERPDALVSHRIRWLAATPSFEAYRKYAEAFELQQMRGDDRGSIALLNEALRIDPDFAEAWALKNFAYGHIGKEDSSNYALNEALKRPQRLTEEGRMFLQGLQHAKSGDYAAADAIYRELIRRGYQLSSSLGNHGWILMVAGRYEEALEAYRRAAHVNPFGPQQWVLGGEIQLLLMNGEVDEARREAAHLRGAYVDPLALAIEATAGNWSRSDSIAEAILRDPIRAASARGAAQAIRMAVASSRGSLRQVMFFLDSARHRAEAAGDAALTSEILERQLLLAVAAGSGAPWPSFRLAGTESDYGLTIRGIIASQEGDPWRANEAMRLAARSQSGKPRKTIRDDPRTVLAGCLLGLEGEWAKAASALAVEACKGESPDDMPGPILIRLLTAKAFEHCSTPDSAAKYYELALAPSGLFWQRRVESKSVSSYVHIRLASIYTRLGKSADAARHREAFVASFTSPDQKFRHLLAQ